LARYIRTAIAQAAPFRPANQDALRMYEVHQPLALTCSPQTLPGL